VLPDASDVPDWYAKILDPDFEKVNSHHFSGLDNPKRVDYLDPESSES
jgi:hypothetical protein